MTIHLPSNGVPLLDRFISLLHSTFEFDKLELTAQAESARSHVLHLDCFLISKGEKVKVVINYEWIDIWMNLMKVFNQERPCNAVRMILKKDLSSIEKTWNEERHRSELSRWPDSVIPFYRPWFHPDFDKYRWDENPEPLQVKETPIVGETLEDYFARTFSNLEIFWVNSLLETTTAPAKTLQESSDDELKMMLQVSFSITGKEDYEGEFLSNQPRSTISYSRRIILPSEGMRLLRDYILSASKIASMRFFVNKARRSIVSRSSDRDAAVPGNRVRMDALNPISNWSTVLYKASRDLKNRPVVIYEELGLIENQVVILYYDQGVWKKRKSGTLRKGLENQILIDEGDYFVTLDNFTGQVLHENGTPLPSISDESFIHKHIVYARSLSGQISSIAGDGKNKIYRLSYDRDDDRAYVERLVESTQKWECINETPGGLLPGNQTANSYNMGTLIWGGDEALYVMTGNSISKVDSENCWKLLSSALPLSSHPNLLVTPDGSVYYYSLLTFDRMLECNDAIYLLADSKWEKLPYLPAEGKVMSFDLTYDSEGNLMAMFLSRDRDLIPTIKVVKWEKGQWIPY